ncbi:C-type lectin domain family 3 member A-like isoform X2 [Biomphalaria glabrata]|nr:C-type lectin domain family 3 member A-like isoform X2 [Biomphalaria glabrata]
MSHETTSLSLRVVPTRILPGITKQLIFNCTMSVEENQKMISLNSIILSRSNGSDQSDIEVLAVIDSFTGRVQVYNTDGLGSGVIANQGVSYLCLQLPFPLPDMAGDYQCDANGMNLSWRGQTISASAKITSSEYSLQSMYKQLRESKIENIAKSLKISELSSHVEKLQKNVTNSTEFIKELQEKDKAALKTLFYESAPYNGRRYYLTKPLALVTITEAQVTCAKYGGYLAEIDDDGEFFFVRNFIIKHPLYQGVFISGTDADQEGHWINQRNNSTLKDVKWFRGEPGGGTVENCLVYWRDCNWYIGDHRCVLFSDAQYIGYLCEIVDI